MSNIRKVSIFLPDSYREEYIALYMKLSENYKKISNQIFSLIDKTTEEHSKMLEKKANTAYDFEFTDPGDVLESIYHETVEFYEMEKLMEYNFKLSSLATAYQMLEQQLRKFMYEEIDHDLNKIQKNDFLDFGTNMKKIKKLYKFVGYDLSSNKHWSDIEDLYDIVNTFKHGSGRSSERLYEKRPALFLKSEFSGESLINQELTSNAAIVLDISHLDVECYINTIINFWKEFPEETIAEHLITS